MNININKLKRKIIISIIDIGIDEKDRSEIAEGLKNLLADSYTLYLQTHNFTL
jgi:starvation-inducible DNA-binding protein